MLTTMEAALTYMCARQAESPLDPVAVGEALELAPELVTILAGELTAMGHFVGIVDGQIDVGGKSAAEILAHVGDPSIPVVGWIQTRTDVRRLIEGCSSEEAVAEKIIRRLWGAVGSYGHARRRGDDFVVWIMRGVKNQSPAPHGYSDVEFVEGRSKTDFWAAIGELAKKEPPGVPLPQFNT